MNKKIKQANHLLIFAIIYISLSLIQKINFYQLLAPNIISNYDGAIPILNVISTVLTLLKLALYLMILVTVKKLCATDKTKRLYNAILYIYIISFVVGLVFSLMLLIPSLAENIIYTTTYMKFSNIYINIINCIYIPFYIAIIIKDGTSFNWYIIGSLTSTSTHLLKKLIHFIRHQLDDVHMIMSKYYFDQTHPALATILHGKIITVANSLLFAVGAIVIAIQVRRKYKATEQLDSIGDVE